MVEAFAQGGRSVKTMVKTYPFCPTSADDDGLTLTNNGEAAVTVELTLAQVQTANVLPAALVEEDRRVLMTESQGARRVCD